jgi:hypothetical protein
VTDIRPRCRYCGRLWLPDEGVDANVSFCSACSDRRRREALARVAEDNAITVRRGGYVVRVPRNTSA